MFDKYFVMGMVGRKIIYRSILDSALCDLSWMMDDKMEVYDEVS